jgi:hypothetical protein
LQFEELCQALLKADLGLGVEAWGGSGDYGKDAYFDGPLEFPTRGAPSEGPFVFQVKFVSHANAAGARPRAALMKAVRAENKRIAHRLAEGRWSPVRHYVLLTNVPLTVSLRRAVRDEVHKKLPDVRVDLLGFRDLGAMLDNAPEIRMSFPQILGLRDLQALLRDQGLAGVLNRSRFSMDLAVSKARVFVRTEAFRRARFALDRHHFVVLTGAPEVGKTTIARMLALGALTDGWGVYECRRPGDVFDARIDDARQIFIADDAFCSTEFRPDQAQEWGDEMERILHALDGRHLLIWTSRPAILSAALDRMHLQGDADIFPEASAVQVDVSELNDRDRALIVYRHARAADLPAGTRELVKRAARSIVGHPHFTPQRIALLMRDGMREVLAAPLEHQSEVLQVEIERRIGEPTKQMRQSLEALPAEHREVLLAMLDAGLGEVAVAELETAYERLGGQSALRSLLDDLSGHFLRVFFRPGTTEPAADWLHPSWRDLMIERLASKAADRRDFLRLCGVDGLFLALSVEGGAVGQRNFPLLPGVEELAIVREQIPRIVFGQPEQTGRVVNLAHDLALERRAGASGRAETLVEPMLLSCRDRWDDSGTSLNTLTLKAWWDTSTLVFPLAASPRLDRTWSANDIRGQIDADMQLFDSSQSALTLGYWLSLVSLIERNEPRFLRQAGFPESHNEIWETVITAAGYELESEWLVDDVEEYDHWADNLNDAADILEVCLALNPALATRAADVIQSLRDASLDKARIADEKREAQEERAQELAWEIDEDEFPVDPVERYEEAPPSERPLAVDTIMEDL